MELKELSEEYMTSGRACFERALELRGQLKTLPAVGTETMELRRRIAILESMAQDAMTTGKYLENYYRRPKNHGNDIKKDTQCELGQGDGIPDLEELCKAIRMSARQIRNSNGRSRTAGTDGTAAPDGAHVLHRTAAHAGDRLSAGT